MWILQNKYVLKWLGCIFLTFAWRHTDQFIIDLPHHNQPWWVLTDSIFIFLLTASVSQTLCLCLMISWVRGYQFCLTHLWQVNKTVFTSHRVFICNVNIGFCNAKLLLFQSFSVRTCYLNLTNKFNKHCEEKPLKY